MGGLNLKRHVPFASVNLLGDPAYREGWVRHHLVPLQCLGDAMLRPFLLALRDECFHMDDFPTNGILLPVLPSVGKSDKLPVHIGGHRNYNRRIINDLHAIRVFCESIRSESRRRKVAKAGLSGQQDRVRKAILDEGASHVDRVSLDRPTDHRLDALIDRLFAVWVR